MTSKIVVNNIESDAGISSVTFTSDIELGVKNLKGHNLESTGIITATSFSGSGANLTSLPAANLTGTLPAISGANLTGINTAFGSGTSVNTSGIITAREFVPTSQGSLSHRNIIINGAMQVAQRGTSANAIPSGHTYSTVDRFQQSCSNLGNTPDIAQSTISSGDAYDIGFRTAYRVTNGDNSATSNDQLKTNYKVEAQDLVQSGWNYKASNQFLTLSFWVKSSVAQTFSIAIYAEDANMAYGFQYSATTSWTKITHSIPGHAAIGLNNDNGQGFNIQWYQYMGTDTTSSSFTNSDWHLYSGTSRATDMTASWFNTNNATFEITGVQLEVGSVATPFEYRSFGEELIRCKRYFNMVADGAEARSGSSRSEGVIGNGFFWSSTRMMVPVKFQVAMRTPNWTLYKKNGEYRYYANGASNQTCTQNDIGLNGQDGLNSAHLNITNISSSSAAGLFFVHDVNAALGFDAEL